MVAKEILNQHITGVCSNGIQLVRFNIGTVLYLFVFNRSIQYSSLFLNKIFLLLFYCVGFLFCFCFCILLFGSSGEVGDFIKCELTGGSPLDF